MYGIGMAKGFGVTLRNFLRKPSTIQYPEEQVPQPPKHSQRARSTLVVVGNAIFTFLSQDFPFRDRLTGITPGNIDLTGAFFSPINSRVSSLLAPSSNRLQ